MENTNPWRVPVEDLEKLDKDTAKFLFDYGEKRLKHLLEVSDRTTTRAISILTLSIPLVGFLLSALFKHYFGDDSSLLSIQILIACWVSIVVCLFCMICWGIVGFPRVMHQMGREPKVLFKKELIDNEYYLKENQFKLILIVETEELQQRIDYMQAQSNRRICILKTGLLTIAFYTGACFITLVLLVLFQ